MNDRETGPEARRLYEDAMERAMSQACRHVAWDQALEVAHDVASHLVQRGATGPDDAEGRSFDALIHRAVTFRLRDLWRASKRRVAAERVHHDERADGTSSWGEPGASLEARELAQLIEIAIAEMPEVMRQVFLSVRRDERSYKDTAHRLGIGVGTVHTHLSRANVRLRQAIHDYESDADPAKAAGPARSPVTKRS